MTRTSLGRLLVEDALPEDLRDFGALDKKGISALLSKVAQKHPERYAEISHRLSNIGRQAATEFGGYSFGLEHLKKTEAAKKHEQQLRAEYKQILDDDTLSDAQRHERILTAAQKHQQPQIDEGYAEAVKANNPLAMQVLSGSRGSKANLNSLLGSDMLYSDNQDRSIPLPIFNGYAHGLSPVEYGTGMYGARKGVVDTKMAIARAGFLGKVLAQVSHRLVVTDHDSETADPDRGLPVDVADHDSVGGLLARTTAGYPRDTVLTPKILAHLKAKGHARILVRSPTVGGSPEGGVYAKDVGMREFGTLPGRGSAVGMTAAQALAEPVSQGTLGSKHCLMRGTQIRMADGSTKAIERIRPGDWVLGADTNRMTFPVRVLDRFDNGLRECYRTTFSPAYRCGEETTVESTLDHKMLCSRQVSGQQDEESNYVPRMLPIGQVSRNFYAHQTAEAAIRYTAKGYDDYRLVRRGQTKIGNRPTYDLHVDHPDHLFVLANGLIVSNSGGVSGQGKVTSGFEYINRLIQVPGHFAGGAAHAGNDGIITGIEDAPAGGKHVWVDQDRHHVQSGADVTVKRGQKVEAGDLLSTGQPDPDQWVAHKGIGEGRRYFTDLFGKTMADAGIKGHRRNIELLARGLINHVRLTDEFHGHSPGDILPYSTIEHLWEPREGHRVVAPKRALGSYLEKPVLHYSIGTKVKPSVARDLEEFGIKEVTAHPEPPPFNAEMIRGMDSLRHDPDWQVRMYGSGLKSGLLESVRRGGVSDEAGTSFVPALAGAVDFGKVGPVHQPESGISEADMAKRKLHPGALKLPEPSHKKSIVSRLGSYLKLSVDEAAEVREALALVKQASYASMGKPKTDATHQSTQPSSSTTNTQGITDQPGGAAGKAAPQPQEPAAPPAPTAPKPSLDSQLQSALGSARPQAVEAGTPPPDPSRVSPQRQSVLNQFRSVDDYGQFVRGAEHPLGQLGRLSMAVPGGAQAFLGLTGGQNYAEPDEAGPQDGERRDLTDQELRPWAASAGPARDSWAQWTHTDVPWDQRTPAQSATAIPAEALQELGPNIGVNAAWQGLRALVKGPGSFTNPASGLVGGQMVDSLVKNTPPIVGNYMDAGVGLKDVATAGMQSLGGMPPVGAGNILQKLWNSTAPGAGTQFDQSQFENYADVPGRFAQANLGEKAWQTFKDPVGTFGGAVSGAGRMAANLAEAREEAGRTNSKAEALHRQQTGAAAPMQSQAGLKPGEQGYSAPVPTYDQRPAVQYYRDLQDRYTRFMQQYQAGRKAGQPSLSWRTWTDPVTKKPWTEQEFRHALEADTYLNGSGLTAGGEHLRGRPMDEQFYHYLGQESNRPVTGRDVLHGAGTGLNWLNQADIGLPTLGKPPDPRDPTTLDNPDPRGVYSRPSGN